MPVRCGLVAFVCHSSRNGSYSTAVVDITAPLCLRTRHGLVLATSPRTLTLLCNTVCWSATSCTAPFGNTAVAAQVLYSLPELDGAIDTVPLGGLVGDNIFLIPERVRRLCSRIQQWVSLRRTAVADRKVAVLLYGFPPGVGATGTAALLNVPRSLENALAAMRDAVR